jgi:Bardet-Biedl syndrome 4 protein
MGKYNQSLEMFLKAESFLQSPDHEIYHFIGKLMSLNTKHQTKTSSTTNTNTTNDAKEYFKRAIMSGHQLESYKELAMMYRREKDFHKSIELLESCLT